MRTDLWIYNLSDGSPRGSTATLIMLWRNSWSITGQTHETLTPICEMSYLSRDFILHCTIGPTLSQWRSFWGFADLIFKWQLLYKWTRDHCHAMLPLKGIWLPFVYMSEWINPIPVWNLPVLWQVPGEINIINVIIYWPFTLQIAKSVLFDLFLSNNLFTADHSTVDSQVSPSFTQRKKKIKQRFVEVCSLFQSILDFVLWYTCCIHS